jgi:hypothetical protein
MISGVTIAVVGETGAGFARGMDECVRSYASIFALHTIETRN